MSSIGRIGLIAQVGIHFFRQQILGLTPEASSHHGSPIVYSVNLYQIYLN